MEEIINTYNKLISLVENEISRIHELPHKEIIYTSYLGHVETTKTYDRNTDNDLKFLSVIDKNLALQKARYYEVFRARTPNKCNDNVDDNNINSLLLL